MTARATCNHPHGDFINGQWACSKCFHFTDGRPYRLGMIPVSSSEAFKSETRQDVIWQAEILRLDGGLPFSAFIKSMVRRFMNRCKDMSENDAIEISLSALRTMGVEYGDPDYDWSRASAIDIADEEMQYFDEAEGGNS